MDREPPSLFSSLLALLRRAPRSALEIVLPRLTEAAPDFTAADRALMARVRPYTMTSIERVTGLSHAVRYLVRAQIPGAMAECGVWKGGSVMVVALTLLELGEVRDLYLFDTFEGMTPPTDRDITYAGVTAAELLASPTGRMRCDAAMDDVRCAVASTGYPMDRVHLIAGRVEDTLPGNAPSVSPFSGWIRTSTPPPATSSPISIPGSPRAALFFTTPPPARGQGRGGFFYPPLLLSPLLSDRGRLLKPFPPNADAPTPLPHKHTGIHEMLVEWIERHSRCPTATTARLPPLPARFSCSKCS